jgi:cell division protein FtsA
MRNQAELLKTKFGSALAVENKETDIVVIPGLKGREPKEISLRNLSNIIQARMEEILEHVHYEIKNSGYDKQLIAGIVLTGGGAQLKHMKQLVEYITGLDCRIGYPNEHVSKAPNEDMLVPSMSTGVGLVLTSNERMNNTLAKPAVSKEIEEPTPAPSESIAKEKQRDNRGPASFLAKIKDFFDAEED